MTIFGLISLINFFTCVSIGTFLLVKSRKNPVNISYCAFDYCISFYAFFYFLWQSSSDVEMGKLFFKLCIVGVVLINSAFVQFSFSVLRVEKKFEKLILLVHGINSFFAFAAFGLFYGSWITKYSYGLWPVPAPTFHVYIIWWFLQVIFCFYILYAWGVLRSSDKLKKQYQWIFWATLIAYAGGATNWLVWYNINFPPYLNSGIAIYTIILGYAIFRHQLLGIDVIIKRTLVFAGLLAFVFSVFTTATFIVQEGLSRIGLGKTWAFALSLIVIVLGYDSIRNFLVNLTDKYLFQKKYNYQELLKDASRGMSKIESLHKLLGLVIHFITMRMRVKNAAILMRRRDREFELSFQRGFDKNFLEYRLDDTNPMIRYLMREKEAVDVEHIREYMEAGNKKKIKGEQPHEYDFQAILLTMQELSTTCAVPSFLGHELQNILLIGEKKSGDYYTSEDLNVLFTLAQESAIAIENAKLFDEALKKSSQLEKINEQLEYSRNLLMKALRETEVANKQLQDTQAQLIHEQKMATLGRLAASVGHEVNNPLTILSMNVSRAILKYRKNPDLRVGEILELFQKMEQNIGRIKAVVNTLTGLLKRSEKGKFEPLSLKLILEETLPLVQFQTYLDNLTGTEVDFDIPGNVPLIRGDLERLQEVFLNLFINAYHAMMGKRNRRIRVTAEMDPENQHNVAVHFTDNGCGMTEEVMKKIFNYGFTTKPPGRGSGMGLYMCKYIIELHGGDIRVRSKVGEGTTFTITLPAYEEGLGDSGGSLRIEATS